MHEIESLFSADSQVPWHGLGTIVSDALLAEEAIIVSGLDWTVSKMRIKYIEDESGHEYAAPPDYMATVRDSDKQIMGIVTNKYQIVQNSEAFDFMDELIGPGRLARYHTAGSLKKGKQIWLLAEVLNLTIEPVKGDAVQAYLLLSNGHDGRHFLSVMWTTVRVVCMNTLRMAISEAKNNEVPSFISFRHTGDMSQKVAQARKVLDLTTKKVEQFSEFAKGLARKKLGDKVMDQFLKDLVPNPQAGKSSAKAEVTRSEILGLYHDGPGAKIPGVLGTAWGALNAVTDYTTHHRSTRVMESDKMTASELETAQREKRLESSWFGSGNDLNQKAVSLLLAL